MNKVELLGRLTKDPEVRFTATNNKKVVNFTLAINRRFVDETDFINCIAWNKTADLIDNYVKKGNLIGVVGSIQTRSYDNKEGKKVYVTEVVADEIYFTDKKEDKYEQNNGEQTELIWAGDTDDLPF